MQQIIQDLKTGATILEDVPAPAVKSGHILIKTSCTLVSLGTERMLVEFGKANLISKARQQPDRVKDVLDKIKSDGLLPTLEAVFNKLGQPLPLGYCNVGIVVEVGKGVDGFRTGDRVVSNGNHAEYVCIPENLAAKIPDNVSNEEAVFTVIGSIGLEGIRLANPAFGETVVVVGLGLIGLLTAQILKAAGCRVIGIEYDEAKIDIARQYNIITCNPATGNDPVKFVIDNTSGIGADAVIIAASAKDSEIVHQAAAMSRKRGRIVLIGVVGLDIRRSDFYDKELSFQVSCSYGPGRYDENYENKGHDYPVAYVRWTEKRNFEAILQAFADKSLNIDRLITERVALDDYEHIYGDMRKKGSIASLIIFPDNSTANTVVKIEPAKFNFQKGAIGIIGSGNFTSSIILPSLKKAGANIKYIASAKGLSAKISAKKANIPYATSDYTEILNDSEVNAVLITTRHNLHAKMILDALDAGKHVYVEKPLCLSKIELSQIIGKYNEHGGKLSVNAGFNRRFSPLSVKLKRLIGDGAMNIVATVNAGFIPPEAWVHDVETGGGRIIGEACHFIDLCSFLAGSNITKVCANSLGLNPKENTDNVSIILQYANGTNAVINYFSNGNKSYSKERIEVYSQGKTFILDNWRELKAYGVKGFSRMRTRQDKGHKNQFQLLVDMADSGKTLIPFESIVNTTLATFAAIESMMSGAWVEVCLKDDI
jgi:predicted dehydrogenase/threonine dehydrogenase-like Zn-dependent dehydrogenase